VTSRGARQAELATTYTPPGGRSLPIIKAPMTATEVKRPFHRPGWVYEEDVDGWRVLVSSPIHHPNRCRMRTTTAVVTAIVVIVPKRSQLNCPRNIVSP
jgi:hypothetical protein